MTHQFFGIDTTQMTNDELAQVIHELNDQLCARLKQIDLGNQLKNVLEDSRLRIKARGTQDQINMRRMFQ